MTPDILMNSLSNIALCFTGVMIIVFRRHLRPTRSTQVYPDAERARESRTAWATLFGVLMIVAGALNQILLVDSRMLISIIGLFVLLVGLMTIHRIVRSIG